MSNPEPTNNGSQTINDFAFESLAAERIIGVICQALLRHQNTIALTESSGVVTAKKPDITNSNKDNLALVGGLALTFIGSGGFVWSGVELEQIVETRRMISHLPYETMMNTTLGRFVFGAMFGIGGVVGMTHPSRSHRRTIATLVRRQDSLANYWLGRQQLPNLEHLAHLSEPELLQDALQSADRWLRKSYDGLIQKTAGPKPTNDREAHDLAMTTALAYVPALQSSDELGL